MQLDKRLFDELYSEKWVRMEWHLGDEPKGKYGDLLAVPTNDYIGMSLMNCQHQTNTYPSTNFLWIESYAQLESLIREASQKNLEAEKRKVKHRRNAK